MFSFKFSNFELNHNSKVQTFNLRGSHTKTRKQLSIGKKLEMREYYAQHKNYRKTARAFALKDMVALQMSYFLKIKIFISLDSCQFVEYLF